MLDPATFKPPGPGAWELEQTHLHRPLSRWNAELFMPNMQRGFKRFTKHYGILLDYLELAEVNRFLYTCVRPVGAPKGAKGPPPKFIFKLVTKLNPEIRRRIRRSAEVWATKAWREDAALWHDEWKPAILRANAELAAIDPAALDDAALAHHLDAVRDRVADGIYCHHAMNGCCMVPVGDFVVHAAGWTGKDARELLALLKGSSPVSCGATAELARLVAALRGDAAAAAALASTNAPGEILVALCNAAGEAGEAARAYRDAVGVRPVSGYDVCELSTIEVPEVMVGAIRAAFADPRPAREAGAAPALADATAKIRELVPEAMRAEFDDKLAEARFVYEIRDQRTFDNDLVAVGLARRAILEAGKRLAARGRIAEAAHAVDLTPDELTALVRGGDGPSLEQLAEHVKYRTSHTIADAPPSLGLPPSGPPPAEWLPPGAARMARGIGLCLQQMFAVAAKSGAPTPKTVLGIAASPGSYEGRARVVAGPEEFGRIEKGDVLVTRLTSPSYNVLLPLLGGVVTDRGGLLSHAAIVAREYGLPAVVGTSDATKVIPDLARVRVDGATGEVHVL